MKNPSPRRTRKGWLAAPTSVLIALLIAGCSQHELTKEELLARADTAFVGDHYQAATKDYNDVLRLDPANPTAIRRLGIIYHNQGQLIQAHALLKRAAESQPDDIEIQLKLGQVYLANGDLQRARDAATEILGTKPDYEQALLLLADATRADQVDETRRFLEGLDPKVQDRAGFHLALGMLHLRRQDQGNAEAEFNAALKADPKSIEAHAMLGVLYLSRNEAKQADQEFKTAAELAPARSPMRVRYAEFKIGTGATDEGRKILEEMIEKAPDYLPPRVYMLRLACTPTQSEDCSARTQNVLAQDPLNYDGVFQDGLSSLSKGDTGKAIRSFEYLSNTYNQNPLPRYQLALAYLQFAKSANFSESSKATESAESRLNEAIRLSPLFEEAVLLFAELKIKKGSAASAIEPLARLTKERPQLPRAHYLLATAYLAQQRVNDALALYRQMTELFPQDPQPQFLIGSLLSSQRRQDEARQAFEKALQIAPDYLPASERLVDLDIADQQYAAAAARAQGAIDKKPSDAQTWALRAKVFLAQRDFARAELDLKKSIELAPEFEAAYALLARVYIASNRQQEAIKELQGFVEKNKSLPIIMLLANLYQQQPNYAAARDAYEIALSINGNLALALNNLAVIYSEHLGQPDKGLDLAKRAREVAPNEPHIADSLGWILFKKGEYANALRLLQESVSKLPNEPEVQYHVGMAHYFLGDERAAQSALQKATDSNTDFATKGDAKQRLAVLTIDVTTADAAARKNLESYLQKQPSDPFALVRLANLQERDGTVDRAIATYEKVVSNYPDFAPAIRQLALLYSRDAGRDVSKAYELASKARLMYPDDAATAKALGILSYRRDYYPRAVELLREASVKDQFSKDPELFYYLGAAHHELKQWSECKAGLERALALNLPSGLAEKAAQALADCSEPSR